MRFRIRLLGLAMLTVISTGCGPINDHLVTGTFAVGRPIGLAYYVPANTVGEFIIFGYADVPVGTPALLKLSGPQDWACQETFAAGSPDGFTNGDSQHDRVVALSSVGFALIGPNGVWTITVEIPSVDAAFSHTWKLGQGGQSSDDLFQLDWHCNQVATSLVQQQRFVQRYITELKRLLLNGPARASQMLEQATQAKLAGDARPDAVSRGAAYRSAAGNLNSLAKFASSEPGLSQLEAEKVTAYANNAAALLLQTGLT